MTDVFVALHETDSRKVAAHIKANPALVAEQIERLEEELHDIGPTGPLLLAFGGDADELLQKHLGHKYQVIKVTHYAHRINKRDYREKVLETTSAGISKKRR